MLTWAALGLSLLAVAQTVARAGRKAGSRETVPSFYLAAAALLVGAVLLLTLPIHSPWARGQGLAPGLVAGAAAVILTALLAAWTGSESPSAAVLPPGLSVLGVGVVLLVTPLPQILYALAGYGIGALVAGVIIAAAPALTPQGTGASRLSFLTTLLGVGLASSVYLATFHRAPTRAPEWQPVPLLFTAAAALLLAGRAVFAERERRAWLLTGGLVFLPLVGVAALLAYRLHGSAAFFRTLLVGMVGFGLVSWLDRSDAGTLPAGRRRIPLRTDVGLLASLLVVGACIPAFRVLHGYGISVLALVGLIVILADDPTRWDRPLPVGTWALVELFTLYRVYEEKMSYTGGVRPDQLYYYVAFLVGALLPLFLANSLVDSMPAAEEGAGADGERRLRTSALFRVCLAGFVAAVSPLLIWLLVGDRAQAAFVVGLPLAVVLTGALLRTHDAVAATRSALLLALGMSLSAIQLTPLIVPLGLRTRTQRVEILAVIAGLVILGMLVTAWRERRWGRPVSRRSMV
jgi:hypothetical protein